MAVYVPDFIMYVLEYARDYGTTVAARHFQLQSSTIMRWNNKYSVYQTRIMRRFSDKQKIEILKYASEQGLSSAMREYGVDVAVIQKWNKKLNIYQQTGQRKNATHKKQLERASEDFILEVLHFVKKYGVSKAVREYGVPDSTIRAWNKKYQIYTPRLARKFSDAQKRLMVKYAAMHTVAQAAKQYDVTGDQIKDWVQKFSEKEL